MKCDSYCAFWIIFIVSIIVWNLAPFYKGLLTFISIIVTLLLIIRLFYWKKVKQIIKLYQMQAKLSKALKEGKINMEDLAKELDLSIMDELLKDLMRKKK